MSFAELQQTLTENARRQIDGLKESYRRQMEQEEQRIKDQARAVEESVIDNAQKEAARQASRLHQEAQLKSRAEVLRVKREELDKVIEETKRQLLSGDKNRAAKLIKGLMSQLPEEEGGTVTPGDEHAELVQREAVKRGFKMSPQTIPGEGGFLFSSRDFEVNMLVGELVKNTFTRHRTEIAKILFE